MRKQETFAHGKRTRYLHQPTLPVNLQYARKLQPDAIYIQGWHLKWTHSHY